MKIYLSCKGIYIYLSSYIKQKVKNLMAARTQKDPYEWPFPSRKDLMSLQTISKLKRVFNEHRVG
jgi:hypothetical protein